MQGIDAAALILEGQACHRFWFWTEVTDYFLDRLGVLQEELHLWRPLE